MLHLQRASAGSGKTYTLARKFIWDFITAPAPGGGRRLCSPGELPDSLTHILAITFTNKATNEMKQRIVEKLAALAEARETGSPDYLEDFMTELGADRRQIADTAAAALAVMLNNYSDLHISTIDSFFQSVLRTFAYETELNDAYRVEIDSDYIAAVGIDSTLDEAEDSRLDSASDTSFWLSHLMHEASASGDAWNAFNKSRNSKTSIYAKMQGVAKRTSDERFKAVRDELDSYFASDVDFKRNFLALKHKYEGGPKRMQKVMADAARQVEQVFSSHGYNVLTDGRAYLASHIQKFKSVAWNGFKDKSKEPKIPQLKDKDKAHSSKIKVPADVAAEMKTAVERFYDAARDWTDFLHSDLWTTWKAYEANLPYLGLLREITRNTRDFLDTNNIVELAETNTLLRRIIGDDEAPFIYERTGTRIHHYLIDEFQDTSRLQWENLRPLVAESEGGGHDNLIIGDAKQSIYRFRNADPSLITTVVPDDFPRHILAGMSEKENTNWRSHRRVVEFNNSFFRILAHTLRPSVEGGLNFAALYANTVQRPQKSAQTGYVEVNFRNSSKDDADLPEYFAELGPKLSSLLQRGYRQRDIAFLVRTKKEGEAVIDAIMGYNRTLGPDDEKIRIVSEESLRLASSPAVGIIIAALRSISGTDEKGLVDFDLFCRRNPGLSKAEQLKAFKTDATSQTEILQGMLDGMQAVALPALVEGIAETFLDEEQRRSQAPFLAALQDAVLEYCDRFTSDVASFLQYWDDKGKTLTISSPDGTDAVQIMTVHKSKGLEFECVIIPKLSWSFLPPTQPDRQEWLWVAPVLPDGDAAMLPPRIPVAAGPALESTPHAPLYASYRDLVTMDALNSLYVAFTRAVRELHIYAPAKPRSGTAGEFMSDFAALVCPDGTPSMLDPADPREDERPHLAKESEFRRDSEEAVLTYGQPTDPSARDLDRQTTTIPIEGYRARSSAPVICTPSDEDNPLPDVTGSSDDEDKDPRSEGSILHSIMELTERRCDLPRAVRRHLLKGVVTRKEAHRYLAMLEKKISLVPQEWFDGSMRVFSERDFLCRGHKNRRPDRIMIDTDGHAVIVDYKFGSSEQIKRHIRQVREYTEALLAAGIAADVEAWLWYVTEDRLHRVR